MDYGRLVTVADPWMDLPTAADYAGTTYRELVDAVTNRKVRTTTTHPQRLGDWMVPQVDVEQWSKHRLPADAVSR
jgi:hypothetical protein